MPRLGPGNGSQYADPRQHSQESKPNSLERSEGKRSIGRGDSQDSYDRIWGSDLKGSSLNNMKRHANKDTRYLNYGNDIIDKDVKQAPYKDKFSEKRFYALDVKDIPGATYKNLKYRDKGKKKMNFYPQD